MFATILATVDRRVVATAKRIVDGELKLTRLEELHCDQLRNIYRQAEEGRHTATEVVHEVNTGGMFFRVLPKIGIS